MNAFNPLPNILRRFSLVPCVLALACVTHGADALQLEVRKGPPVTLAVSGEPGSVVELQRASELGSSAQWSTTDTLVLQAAAAEVRPAQQGYFRAVSRDPAPAGLQAGEVYIFSIPQAGMSDAQVFLLLDSPTEGQLVRYANTFDNSMQPVRVNYLKLGPLAARLDVLLDSFPGPATNTYTLVYMDRGTGWCQENRGIPSTTVGVFRRDTSWIGRTVLPDQLQPGELYRLRMSDGPTSTEIILAMNTPGTGMLARIGLTPDSGIQEAAVRYKRFGPLTAQFEVLTTSVMGGITNAYTNVCTTGFLTTDGGWCKVASSDATARIGTIDRITNLVGQSVAPQACATGDTYHFSINDAATSYETIMVFNTPSDAMVVQPGIMPGSGIQEATVDYHWFGPLASAISVTMPDATIPDSSYTNRYTLLYLSARNGWCEAADRWGMKRSGTFILQPWQASLPANPGAPAPAAAEADTKNR